MGPWKLVLELLWVCRTVVADSHHFYEEEPDPLQSVTAVPDPHHSEKPDPESDGSASPGEETLSLLKPWINYYQRIA
jgi:hypothetical protein